MGILLVSPVLAYSIEVKEDWSEVLWEGDSFNIKGIDTYCNILYEGDETCDNKIYLNWANKEAQDTIDLIVNTVPRETEVIIADETIKTEDYEDESSWLVGIIKKLVEKIQEAISSINEVKAENQLLKDELCKKDSSYKFCVSVGDIE